jgi:hypothetical protein
MIAPVLIWGTKLMSSVGLMSISTNVFKAVIPKGAGMINKACVGVSLAVIEGVVGEQMWKYVDDTKKLIEETMETIRNKGQEKDIRKRLKKIEKM